MKNFISRYRFEHNRISQAELADATRVSRQTINSIENGKFNPSVKLALRLAQFFGCTVEELFILEGDEI